MWTSIRTKQLRINPRQRQLIDLFVARPLIASGGMSAAFMSPWGLRRSVARSVLPAECESGRIISA